MAVHPPALLLQMDFNRSLDHILFGENQRIQKIRAGILVVDAAVQHRDPGPGQGGEFPGKGEILPVTLIIRFRERALADLPPV